MVPVKIDKYGRPLMSAYVSVRPYAREILIELKKHYEIIIFTASHKLYAKAIVKYLDPNSDIISYVLTREHCVLIEKMLIKDLRVIKNRDLKNMVIVDNCVSMFVNQLKNGIPILPFEGEMGDTELKLL
jgi:CTD small phosphatase-like protein 2